MKDFFRTVCGKTFLFFGCNLFLICFLLSLLQVALGLSYDYYTRPEQLVFNDLVCDSIFQSNEYSLAWTSAMNYENAVDKSAAMYVDNQQTNLIYEVLDENGVRIGRSRNAKPADEEWLYSNTVHVIDSVSVDRSEDGSVLPEPTERLFDKNYTLNCSLVKGLPEIDSYSAMARAVHISYRMRFFVFPILLVSLMLLILSFVELMSVSARRPKTEDLFPGPLFKIPYDLLLVIGSATVFLLLLLINIFPNYGLFAAFVSATVFFLLVYNLVLGFLMGAAARIKTGTLLKNTVIFLVIKLTWTGIKAIFYTLRQLPAIWRTCAILFGITFIELFVIILTFWEMDNFLIFWIIEKMVLIPIMVLIAINTQRLEEAGIALANGQTDFVIDRKALVGRYKRHADNLSNLQTGMNRAVDEKLKSERMKTELITNVSHDIKTPLTSIINYANLIGLEKTDNDKITEYSAILTKQSARLKRLIEDLVEASKASTGNLEVNPVQCDAAVFINQADGEYEEKLENAGLELITKIPEEPVYIMADGRRMWRVFDNLMNNICKYAQNGTRVYLSLEKVKGLNGQESAVMTFKNTSAAKLDISAEELMERFVRGDSSRNTEGNGLGLSIAQSLAELQNGSLKLDIDGDLFKAILTFPIVPPSIEENTPEIQHNDEFSTEN